MPLAASGLREFLQRETQALRAQGIYLGTSSWKYPGWAHLLYDPARYDRGRGWSKTRFERQCLAEYAEVFSTVCVDAAYYQFPSAPFLDQLTSQVPSTFQFGFKVTDDITLKRFPFLDRHGARKGSDNDDFLNAELFVEKFLNPCESVRSQVGILIFEFSRFHVRDFQRGRDFVEQLDRFLGKLPTGWPYGVEIRNRTFLQAEYFEVLARHAVTHVFNSWQAMPPIHEQLLHPAAFTTPSRVAARFLLRPGRVYADAVTLFSPYQEVRDPFPEARAAGAELIRKGREAAKQSKPKRTFLFVNNRLEGNALHTLQAMIAQSHETPEERHT